MGDPGGLRLKTQCSTQLSGQSDTYKSAYETLSHRWVVVVIERERYDGVVDCSVFVVVVCRLYTRVVVMVGDGESDNKKSVLLRGHTS
jgi:hypothetical protein